MSKEPNMQICKTKKNENWTKHKIPKKPEKNPKKTQKQKQNKNARIKIKQIR